MDQKERLAELLSEAPLCEYEEKLSKLTQVKHLLLNLVCFSQRIAFLS